MPIIKKCVISNWGGGENIIKLRGDEYKSLHELPVSYKDRVKLDPIVEGEKISILSDSMLKTMFQNENRIKYSAWLLAYYLDIPYEKLLKNIHLAKNELDKEKEHKKGEKCDYVALIDDSFINIEVNNNGSVNTLERNMDYAHRLYSKLIRKGKKTYEYTQVIQVNLNNFSFVGNDKIVDTYVIQNNEHLKLSNKLIFIQIYIPNLIRKWYTEGKKGLEESEKYLLTLVLRPIEEVKELGRGIKIMEEYVKDAEYVVLDDDLRESYDKELAMKDLGHQEGYIDGYEIGKSEGLEQGKLEGLEQGKLEGLEQGKLEGLEQGKHETKNELVKKMLNEDIDLKTISKITGLNETEIKDLK